ncbi:ISLre2 family transposase [Streptococcus acidominimus]|uniref:Transposase n=1 Tax=Streptococcus acidominimus TaxID=1326 RepID=A0A1Q8EFL7_STRAI|nr:ISLre2 family transposase [Streptococcus acidominimus]OLF50594.1 transposase [Streptococcus acidominimus]SUN05346.1 DDE transposase [Streptococcus acidominimus]SUN40911.1 DDE transposase [Streptococcus acidominimus]
MDTRPIDERDFVSTFRKENQQKFFQFLEQYENYIAPIMRARGYRCKDRIERTVLFTFGELTFSRSRWYKGKQCRIPVDEKLGLTKHVRYSQELMYQVARLSQKVPYRKVPEIIEMMYGICISKDTVNKAVQMTATLLEEREDYRFYEEEATPEKISSPIIYVEGDGSFLKSQEKDKKSIEFSHFVIHTGSKEVGKNRYELQNKIEISSCSNRKARERVLDYIYNHFEITEDTILVTNSDGGKGYTPYVFKELAKALKIQRHEHFWDKYHVFQDIRLLTRNYPTELRASFFRAIQVHSKAELKTCFDTLESLIEIDSKKELERFEQYKSKFMKNFQYTKSAELRDLSLEGVGIMESQHRKITYRMKNRGMYWTRRGAEAMSQMLILDAEELRELFFGEWRKEYEYYRNNSSSAGRADRVFKETSSVRTYKAYRSGKRRRRGH